MSQTRNAEAETAPLISDAEPNDGPDEIDRDNRGYFQGSGRRITVLLTAVIFITTTGSGLTSIPTLRVVEDIICRRLRVTSLGDFDEEQCKGDDIQAELSFVLGIQSMVEAIPSMTIPVSLP